ncbi:hypothetical protein TNCT_324111 [Trichonephila clavata]|uniref:Uncharacterized protein n=1 Tax=Trichonephila clavata TaxID=2740835 RepID=A0A8X6FWQ5_TRICU|nr:hypothetical protein TNCT_324111 [Trichonephila clavata]
MYGQVNNTFEEYMLPFVPKSPPTRYPEVHNEKVSTGQQRFPQSFLRAPYASTNENSYPGCLAKPEG